MNQTSSVRRRFRFIKLVMLMGLVLVPLASCGEPESLPNSYGAREDRPAHWPPFTMTYEVNIKSPTSGWDVKVWELVYEDEWNWTKTMLENSADPSAVGTTHQFSDNVLTITQAGVIDAETGKPWSFRTEYPDAPVAPEPWLLRDRDLLYLERGYLDTEDTVQQLLTFVMDGTVPCQDDPIEMLGQPEACRTSPTYRTSEETVYTTEVLPPLPVKFAMTIEGEVVSAIEVTKLSVTVAGTEVIIR